MTVAGDKSASDDATEATRSAIGGPAISRPIASESLLEHGARMGRYTILSHIGSGGMGVIYAAYDPKLDRRVALKLLRAGDDQLDDTEARTRLLREAQAMARLSHPNVIAVYDVGTFDDEVFVAMEYVPGRNLSRWLREEETGWEEVLGLFIQAGRGLAAAHASDLVHRDFKPSNVIVGEDGRVRVLDFGLARSASARPRASSDSGVAAELFELTPEQDSLQTPVTKVGNVVGTPFYMSPEQYGTGADARSDQYSFCVALYEGLYGERPFGASRHSELRARALAGDITTPPRDSKVPSRYLDAIRRGLSPRPADRFPSMDALLAALTLSRRKLWRAVVAALVTTVTVAALLVFYLRSNDHAEGCKPARDKLSAVWDEGRKLEIEAAFLATDRPYAGAAWTNVARTFDEYGAAWLAMQHDTCMATEVRHEQSEQLLDLRMLCLSDRLSELRALSNLFVSADADVVERAVQAAAGLTPVDTCANVRALTERVAPPDDEASRARLTTTYELVAEAGALRAAGKFATGLEVAERAIAAAREIGYRPLEGEALLVKGALLLRAGDATAAEPVLREAELAASAGRDDGTAILAATQLVFAVGYRQGNHAEGDWWARTALALLERGGGDDALAGNVHFNLAVLRTLQGKYDEAEEHARLTLELRERALGKAHPLTAAAHHIIGVVLKKKGAYSEALAATQRSLDILRARLGDDHPDVAMALHNLGVIHKRLGNLEAAATNLRRALSIWERTLATDHPNIGMLLLNLGVVEASMGKNEEARAYLERARAIKVARLGPDHSSVAKTDLALGDVLHSQQQYSAALAVQRRALTDLERTLGDNHPELATALDNVATTYSDLGDYPNALDHHRRALAIRERGTGAGHPDLTRSLTGIGRAELGLGHTAAAIAALERAETIFANSEHLPARRAECRFLLAQASWQENKDRALARQLAERALAAFGQAGAQYAANQRSVADWLEAHTLDKE